MASKTKFARLESEIERHRVDCNWKKSIEVAQQQALKATDLGSLVTFLEGEKLLEEYVETNDPLVEDNYLTARATLTKANEKLSAIVQGQSKLREQAVLLLAKIQFCQGFYQVALSTIDTVDLQALALRQNEGETQKSVRLLYLVAETYAIKGKSLEHTKGGDGGRLKRSDEDEIIECYQFSADCALLCLQQRDKITSQYQATESNFSLSTLLEMAISIVPVLYLKHGDSKSAVIRYREMLTAVESKFSLDIRKGLSLSLAKFLLRFSSSNCYQKIDKLHKNNHKKSLKPAFHSSSALFLPQTLDEEILLLLRIAEAVATRGAVLERNKESHEVTLKSVSPIYDMLALVLVKRSQFGHLSESFEKAMRFSFEEFHIWYQYANSLISSNKFGQAILVLNACHRMDPSNATVCLQAARISYEHLQNFELGLEWSEKAIKCEPDYLSESRAHLSLGIGMCMLARESKLDQERQSYNFKALEEFKKAQSIDPQDYLATFHLALQYATLRKINEAMTACKLSLKLRSDFIHSLHLMVLLLSSHKSYAEAMALIMVALKEYPDNLSLMMTKAKLEKVLYGPEQALATYQKMLKLWKELHEMDVDDDGSDSKSRARDRTNWDKRSLAQMTFNERGSGSIRAESMAASRVEKALSDLASSMNSSFQPRAGPQRSWVIQAQIWLNLAQLYLSLNQVKEAQGCVQETFQLFPHSVYVFFMKGLVLEHRGLLADARVSYENAISVNPSHTKSLHHLGIVLYKLEEYKLAEKVLKDAVNVDPCFHKAWFVLGTVLEALGDAEGATNCHLTGLQLENSCPVATFSVIQRVLS